MSLLEYKVKQLNPQCVLACVFGAFELVVIRIRKLWKLLFPNCREWMSQWDQILFEIAFEFLGICDICLKSGNNSKKRLVYTYICIFFRHVSMKNFKIQCNLDLVTLNSASTCDLVNFSQRRFFNLLHEINQFSDIM